MEPLSDATLGNVPHSGSGISMQGDGQQFGGGYPLALPPGHQLQANQRVVQLVSSPLDERTRRHMLGACCGKAGWVLCWMAGYACMITFSFVILSRSHPELMQHTQALLGTWVCTILAGVGIPSLAYLCMGKPAGVAFGLMADFYWWGGIGGVIIAVIGEIVTSTFFLQLSPSCNTSNKESGGSDTGCQMFLLVQWIAIPGFWEELFKAVWVFLRFKSQSVWTREDEERCGERTTTERVPRKTCMAFDTTCCTFWWRLAETPVAVFLAAMAAGGGFESIENIEYMFPVFIHYGDNDQAEEAVAANLVRAVLSLHVVWTGYIGIRLAQRQFSSQLGIDKPSWAVTLLPTMLVHGLWDWFAFGNYLPFLLWAPLLFILSICMVVVPIWSGALRPTQAGLVADVLAPTLVTPMTIFTVPHGVQGGQQLYVNMPDGSQVFVTLPMGVIAGQNLQVMNDGGQIRVQTIPGGTV